MQMMLSVWCGGNRFEEAEVTRFDQVLGSIFGIHCLAHFQAITPVFGKYTQTVNDALLNTDVLHPYCFAKVRYGFPDLTVSSKSRSRFRGRSEWRRGDGRIEALVALHGLPLCGVMKYSG